MSESLILGIDGGGTSTTAWIATAENPAEILGRGTAGASNPQAVGVAAATAELERAVAAAFANAALPPRGMRARRRIRPGPPRTVAAACIALAGIDRDADRTVIENWAAQRRLAERLRVVNDALPVLYAANEAGVGIAVISGTGSFAFGRTADGETARAGGWGYLFGDDGSAYAIAVAGLRAAARAADGRGPATEVLDLLLDALQRRYPQELITAIYDPAMTRAKIAALSTAVFRAHDAGDDVAAAIIERAVGDLADQIAAVAARLSFPDGVFPLALTGGVLLNRADVQRDLVAALEGFELTADPVVPVFEPVAGALVIARNNTCDSIEA